MPQTRKMLSDLKAPAIQSLMKLIENQSKTTLAGWAINYSDQVILPIWEKSYPDDYRPQNALNAARRWLSGIIMLPEAKKIILICHTAAREASDNPTARAAARAIGQCASTIHSARHCIGLAFYGALAVAYDRLGTGAAWEQIERYAYEECGRMEAALLAVAVLNETHPAKIEWKASAFKAD